MPRYGTKLKPKPKPKRNLLPLWLGLAGLALVLIAGFAIWSNNAAARANVTVKGAPRLKVDTGDVVDHGEVKLMSSIQDQVRVTNIGDQPLRFSEAPYIEVKEGC